MATEEELRAHLQAIMDACNAQMKATGLPAEFVDVIRGVARKTGIQESHEREWRQTLNKLSDENKALKDALRDFFTEELDHTNLIDIWRSHAEKAGERLRSVENERDAAYDELRREQGAIANALDHFDGLPNDVKSDPAMESLTEALHALRVDSADWLDGYNTGYKPPPEEPAAQVEAQVEEQRLRASAAESEIVRMRMWFDGQVRKGTSMIEAQRARANAAESALAAAQQEIRRLTATIEINNEHCRGETRSVQLLTEALAAAREESEKWKAAALDTHESGSAPTDHDFDEGECILCGALATEAAEPCSDRVTLAKDYRLSTLEKRRLRKDILAAESALAAAREQVRVLVRALDECGADFTRIQHASAKPEKVRGIVFEATKKIVASLASTPPPPAPTVGTPRRFDHKYEPGAYRVCRRCGADYNEHQQAVGTCARIVLVGDSEGEECCGNPLPCPRHGDEREGEG